MMLISDHTESDKHHVSSSWTHQLEKCIVELLLNLNSVWKWGTGDCEWDLLCQQLHFIVCWTEPTDVIIIVQFATFLSVVT